MYKTATKNNSGQEQKPKNKGPVSGNTSTRQQSLDKAQALNPVDNHSALPMQCKALGDSQVPPVIHHTSIERRESSANNGLPMQLKNAIENYSGFAMDDVKVHYNSNKPAQLQAHAYAQGNDIYLGPGQEKHLPHEAWHVVQQKQGRVKPTLLLKDKTTINYSDTLEKEADVMGHKIVTHSKTIQQAVAPHANNDASKPIVNGPVVNRSVIQCRLKSLDISVSKPQVPEVELYILQDGKFIPSNEKTPYKTVLECYPVLGRDEWIWVRLDLPKGTATGYLRYGEVDKNKFTPSTVKQKVPGVIGFDSKVTLAPGEQPQKAQPVSSGLHTWYQNQALLLEAYQRLNNAKTGETAEQRQQTQQDLALAILQSYAKVASIATPNKRYSLKKRQQVYGKRKRVEFATSPVFEEAGTAYYRSHGPQGNLYQWLHERVSGDFPKNIGTLKVVAEPSFIDVVRRKSPPRFNFVDNETESTGSVEPMPQINLQVNDLEGFAGSINALYAGFAAGYTPQNTLLFDFSAMQCEPKAIAATIIGPAKNIIRQAGAKSAQPDALDKYLGGMMLLQHRGMNVFLMFNLGNTSMGISENDIDKTMKFSGQMVDPISIKKFMLAYESVDNILKDQGIKIAQTTEWNDAKQQKMTLKMFVNNRHFLAFSALGKADKYTLPHYQRVHAAGIVSLLQGLHAISAGGLSGSLYAGLDHLFKHKGLTDLLRVSYHRMLAAMEHAVAMAEQDDMVQFLNQIEFLHDQLQIILGLVKPYAAATVFENALIKQLFMAPWNDSNSQSVLPGYITQPNSAYDYIPETLTGNKVRPKVYHKPSAMNTLSSILAATEKQKGNNRLNVLVLENTYYESVGYIDKMSKKYESGAVDVNAYNVSRLNSAKNIQRGSDNNGNKDTRFDIFICESHHNINELSKGYQQENIVDLIRHLFDKKLVSDRFTVAMDGTMNYIRSVELQQILTTFKKEITSGRLNIAFFRSAQKFDMLGMDNYYGGYGVSINQNNAYKAFNDELSQQTTPGLAHQGLTHLMKYGANHLDNYREAIQDNAKYLYQRLYQAGLHKPGGFFKLITTEDPQFFFVHIDSASMYNLLKDWAFYNDLSLTGRPSFGFSTFNIIAVRAAVRLTPGLESRRELDMYADFLIKAYYSNKLNAAAAKHQKKNMQNRNKPEYLDIFDPKQSVENFMNTHVDFPTEIQKSKKSRFSKFKIRKRLFSKKNKKVKNKRKIKNRGIPSMLRFNKSKKLLTPHSAGLEDKQVSYQPPVEHSHQLNKGRQAESEHNHLMQYIGNFFINQTIGDGSCFYHAIHEVLTGEKSNSKTEKAIRAGIIEYLNSADAHTFLNGLLMLDENLSRENLVKLANEDRAWANQHIIAAAANAYRLQIIMLDKANNHRMFQQYSHNNPQRTVFLSCQVDHHFDSITATPLRKRRAERVDISLRDDIANTVRREAE